MKKWLILLLVGGNLLCAGPYDKAAVAYARKLGLDISNPKVQELIAQAAYLKDTLKIANFMDEQYPYITTLDPLAESYKEYVYKFKQGIRVMPTGTTKVTINDFMDPKSVIYGGVKAVIAALNDKASTYTILTEEEKKTREITDPYEEGIIPGTIKASTGDTRTTVHVELDGIKRYIIGKAAIKPLADIRELNKAMIENVPKDLEYFAFRVRGSRVPTEEITVPSYYIG